MFNQSKVVPTVLSTTPKNVYLSNQIPKESTLHLPTNPMAALEIFPLSRWNWPWATSQKAHDECAFPWQETIEGVCGSSKLQNSHTYIYIHYTWYIHNTSYIVLYTLYWGAKGKKIGPAFFLLKQLTCRARSEVWCSPCIWKQRWWRSQIPLCSGTAWRPISRRQL